MRSSYLLLLSALFFLSTCQQNTTGANKDVKAQKAALQQNTDKLSDYWYQGKAELNTYELKQNRYKDIHPGEVVAIFVTEDFLTDKQVKNDNYQNPNSIPILKTNILRRFTTGIYDYSIMTSVFTPVEATKHPHTIKVSTSSQDWCGQSWMQLNMQKKEYQMELRSYFENEGDKTRNAPLALLEDEIMNRIRMNPAGLPVGNIQMIPSNHYLRLAHRSFGLVDANASLAEYEGEVFEGAHLMEYKIEIAALNRILTFVFQTEPPYSIEGWTDTYPSAFDQQKRTTTAIRKNTILEPYWQQNNPVNAARRSDIGLGGF